jgi:hypothetical protein
MFARHDVVIDSFMISCLERHTVREQTLLSFSESDWPRTPEIIMDEGTGVPNVARIARNWERALARAASSPATLVLIVEDDLVIGRWLLHNLMSWPVVWDVASKPWFMGSLYNPCVPVLRECESRWFVAHPRFVWGAQALVLTPQTIRFVLEQWNSEHGHPDERIPRLASRRTPIYYHRPSLVEHRDGPSTWGGFKHGSRDFDVNWRAETT